MSDIKKLLSIMSESGTTAGSIAPTSGGMGTSMLKRPADTIFAAEDIDPDADTGLESAPKVSSPSNFGLWKNSSTIGKEQVGKHGRKKMSVDKTDMYPQLKETRDRRDSYERDYDSSVSGMGRPQDHRDPEGSDDSVELKINRKATDDMSDAYYNITLDGKPQNPEPIKGHAAAKKWGRENHDPEKLDLSMAKITKVKQIKESTFKKSPYGRTAASQKRLADERAKKKAEEEKAEEEKTKVKEGEWDGTGQADMAAAVTSAGNGAEDAETEKQISLSEAEITEEMIADRLKNELALFKKGSKSADREISKKPADREVQKKK